MGSGGGKDPVLTLFAALIVFSILIIVHELGHMLAAKRVGVKVEKFSVGFGKKLIGFKKGDTEYALSIFPFGGYVKLAGDTPDEYKGEKHEFFSKSILERFFIIVSGALTNYIFAFLLFICIFAIGIPSLTTQVGKLLPNYPAKTSGIRVGDIITEIDGQKIEYWDDLVSIVQKSTSEEALQFKVERNSRTLNLRVAPKVIVAKNIFGQETKVGMIGISPQEKIVFVRHNFIEASYLGGKKLIALTVMTYKGLWLLITGGLPAKESIAGPIGIAFLIGEAAKMGFIHLLSIMAYINVALAVFNLLPFPVLDGGHVLFLAIEKIRGKAISAKTQEIIAQVAFYLLLALVVFVTWNDITRHLPFFKK